MFEGCRTSSLHPTSCSDLWTSLVDEHCELGLPSTDDHAQSQLCKQPWVKSKRTDHLSDSKLKHRMEGSN